MSPQGNFDNEYWKRVRGENPKPETSGFSNEYWRNVRRSNYKKLSGLDLPPGADVGFFDFLLIPFAKLADRYYRKKGIARKKDKKPSSELHPRTIANLILLVVMAAVILVFVLVYCFGN